MELKDLFARLFPTKQAFNQYLEWREQKKQEQARAKRINNEIEKARLYMAVCTDDPDDDDFEPMVNDIWEQVNGS